MDNIEPITYGESNPRLAVLSKAYTSLLLIDVVRVRIKIQDTLCLLRNEIAEYCELDAQKVQEDHEERSCQIKHGLPQVIN